MLAIFLALLRSLSHSLALWLSPFGFLECHQSFEKYVQVLDQKA